jgi:hypothetical protein
MAIGTALCIARCRILCGVVISHFPKCDVCGTVIRHGDHGDLYDNTGHSHTVKLGAVLCVTRSSMRVSVCYRYIVGFSMYDTVRYTLCPHPRGGRGTSGNMYHTVCYSFTILLSLYDNTGCALFSTV